MTTSPGYRSTLVSAAARTWRAEVVVAVISVLPPAGASAATAPLFTFRDPQIAESSGIVASATRDDVFFTHNDSGDTARFFAVDRYGCTLGVFSAPGVTATDWEDIARGPGNSLWLGDIGDNNANRAEIAVHRFAEPALGASTNGSACPGAAAQTVAAASYRLRFEDGPHDAETLLVDPRTSQVFIITKSFTAGALYAAPNPLSASDVNVLHKVSDVATPAFASGGDISSNGQEVAVRNYGEIDIRTIPNGNLAAAFAPSAPVQRLDAPDSGKQGEGLGFTRTGRNLLTSSEGVGAPVFLIPRPDPTPPDLTKPGLTLGLARSVFRAAGSGPAISARKKPIGTKVTSRLTEPSSVKFTVDRKARGRKVGRRCKAKTKANAKKKSCARWVKVKGSFTMPEKAGRNSFKFRGRIGGKKLKPGHYRLNGTATDLAKNTSAPKRRSFKIVR
jgi:hypothetical protein